jgi:serine/threonine protein kinase
MDSIVFEIEANVWQKAKEIQQQLMNASDPAHKQQILAGHCADGIILGDDLGTTYLPRYHQIKTSAGPKPVGVAGLKHNFIAINDELYAIANQDERASLGKGVFGEVFLGQNSQGKACAIKVELTRRHHPNEADALDKLGYLQGKAYIGEHVYTIMDVFPGKNLMNMHERGSAADPWKTAAQEFGHDLNNLAAVKKALMGYTIDDQYERNLACEKMSKGRTEEFTETDLENLQTRAAEIQNQTSYTYNERMLFALASAQQVKNAFDAGILHRDIKGDNFVGELNQDGSVNVAMIDFGGATDIEKAAGDISAVGTPNYMAPEVLGALPLDKLRRIVREEPIIEGDAQFSTASDVFSFAMMCELDFGLDDDAGFGILKLAKATNPKDRPSIEDITCLLKADLALQSNNPAEQKQVLTEVEALKPSACVTTALFKLRKAELTHIQSAANPKANQDAQKAQTNPDNEATREPKQ